MAFLNRFGSIMGRIVSQNAASSGQNSMLNAVRCMSSARLFIGGLSYSTDEQSLKEAFSGFGEVVDAKVINDRETGRSRGFGFVSFDSEESAQSAMSSMDGQPLAGRNIRVSFATERVAGAPRVDGPRESIGGW